MVLGLKVIFIDFWWWNNNINKMSHITDSSSAWKTPVHPAGRAIKRPKKRKCWNQKIWGIIGPECLCCFLLHWCYWTAPTVKQYISPKAESKFKNDKQIKKLILKQGWSTSVSQKSMVTGLAFFGLQKNCFTFNVSKCIFPAKCNKICQQNYQPTLSALKQHLIP